MPLDAVTEAPTGARTLTTKSTGVTTYDFRRPTKLSREGVRLLQVTFDTFARRLTTLLTSSLRQVCQVTLDDISQQSYEDYISSRQVSTLIVPVALPQLQTSAVVEFSLPVALTAIDHMLGGPGGQQPERPLTDIETTLMNGLLEQVVGVLAYAMEPICPLQPNLGMIEYNPQFIQVVGATDATLVALFTMTVGKQATELSLCIPLAPLLPKLNAHRDRNTQASIGFDGASDETRRVATHVADMPVTVTVEFATTRLTTDQALGLDVGDIIDLPHRVGAPLTVNVGSVTYATAIAGRSGSRLAAQITETL